MAEQNTDKLEVLLMDPDTLERAVEMLLCHLAPAQVDLNALIAFPVIIIPDLAEELQRARSKDTNSLSN